MLKPYEEIYHTEVAFDQHKVISVDVKNETFKISTLHEKEIDEDAIFINPNVLEALLAGLEAKGFKEVK